MTQKCLDIGSTQLTGMLAMMESNKPADSMDISLLGSQAHPPSTHPFSRSL